MLCRLLYYYRHNPRSSVPPFINKINTPIIFAVDHPIKSIVALIDKKCHLVLIIHIVEAFEGGVLCTN